VAFLSWQVFLIGIFAMAGLFEWHFIMAVFLVGVPIVAGFFDWQRSGYAPA